MKHLFATLVIVALTLTTFATIIAMHHRHLATGTDIYVRLAPTDPRSLIQGDYMTLNYELFLQDTVNLPERNITLWANTDHQNKLTQSYLNQKPNTRPLVVKNPYGVGFGLYPAADSFMFAEGLSKCYQTATYAHLKTDNEGKPILVNLVDDDLKDLACQQKSQAKEL